MPIDWSQLFTYNSLHDLVLCLVAFVVHELAHIWVAKRKGIYAKTTVWKIFGFIPIGALVWVDKSKATIQDQIDVASAGIWAGLPFTLLMFRPFVFFSAYMIASFFDILSTTILNLAILSGISKKMTIKEAGNYNLSFTWRGIKLKKKSQTTGLAKEGSSTLTPAKKVGEKKVKLKFKRNCSED